MVDKAQWMKLLCWGVGCIILSCFFFVGFKHLGQSVQQISSVEERVELYFEQPLTKLQQKNALDYLASNAEYAAVDPVFWSQQEADSEGAFPSHIEYWITYDGDITTLWPFILSNGRFPATDEEAIISDTLAQALWGSTDCIGQLITCESTKFKIVGIFHAAQSVLCCWSDQSAFDRANLFIRSNTMDSYEIAASFGASAHTPFRICWQFPLDIIGSLLTVFPLLPAIPTLLLIIWHLLGRIGQRQRELIVWLLVLFIAGVVLPDMLRALPAWIIPSQWSNFTFWQDLAENWGARLEESLMYPSSLFILWTRMSFLAALFWSVACFGIASALRWLLSPNE